MQLNLPVSIGRVLNVGRLLRIGPSGNCERRISAWFMGLLLISCSIVSVSGSIAAQTMRLVTGNDLAPYTEITLPNGGMVTEIVTAAYSEMGLSAAVSFGAWDQGFNDTLRGRFEATFPYQPDQVTSDRYYLSRAIIANRQSIFVSSRGNQRFWTLSELSGKKFCIAADYRPNRELEVLKVQFASDRSEARTLADCFGLLKNGEVDYVPAYDLMGQYIIANNFDGANEFTILREPLSIGTFHLLIPKEQPNSIAHRQNFDRALESIEASGLLQSIVRRHVSR